MVQVKRKEGRARREKKRDHNLVKTSRTKQEDKKSGEGGRRGERWDDKR